jgi:hypothetical protein
MGPGFRQDDAVGVVMMEPATSTPGSVAPLIAWQAKPTLP